MPEVTVIGKNIIVGWDRPLDVNYDYHLPELRRAIQNYAPCASGALRSAFNDPMSAKMNAKGDTITIAVEPPALATPYAAIQNYGGPSQDIRIRPRFKKALSFMWHGRRVFFKSVLMRAGSIRGKHFVEHGVYDWLGRILGLGKVTWVRWRRPGEKGGTPSAFSIK